MAASTEDKSTTAARMKTGKKREANYELLRITAMFMVVCLHYLSHAFWEIFWKRCVLWR